MVPIRAPSGVNASSTGLSKPPPQIRSIPVPSRRHGDHRHHHLRQRLLEVTGLHDGADPVDVAVAAYASVATARSRVALASLEDALGVEERTNVPGTTSEWPNWRLALPQPLEEIERASGPTRIAEVMAAAGRSAKRRPGPE